MNLHIQYALTRWLPTVSDQEITRWIERPHLLQPEIVGISEQTEVRDRETNGAEAWLGLAVWAAIPPHLADWPVDIGSLNRPLWLLTTWTDDPGLEHLLTAVTGAETLAELLKAWPAAANVIPLDSDWLDDAGRSLVALTPARY